MKTIVMLGDSLTFGHNWQEAFPRAKVHNLGQNGDTVRGVWSRLDQVITINPDQVFLLIGINDLLCGATSGEIITGQKRIWDELAKLPQTRLYIISLLPYMEDALPSAFGGFSQNLILRGLNEQLKTLADENKLTFINLFPLLADEDLQLQPDFTTDGLHLSPAAYKVWEEAIRPFIEPPR
ncbi:MAG: GDSL-type esterase/lipase family protein [Candidatus Adiutrix sp.]